MHRIVALLTLVTAVPVLAAAPDKAPHKPQAKAQAKARASEPSDPAEAAPVHLPPPPALPSKYVAVALLPIQLLEASEALGPEVEQTLLDEIDETEGFRAISSADAMGDLSAVGLRPSDCERDLGCLAQAGRYARAHAVLDVHISGLGGTLNCSMRLIDTTTGQELGRAAEELPDDAQARLLVLHRMGVQLLTPDTYLGQLLVKSKQSGLEVYVDDALAGMTPMQAASSLRAGMHILRVSKEGFTDVNRFVEITYNRTTTLDVEMEDTTVNVQVDLIAAKNDGSLFILAAEEGYEVRIDGEPAGVTPLQGALVHLSPGAHQVTLRKAGRPVVQQTVTIAPQQRADFALKEAKDGALSLESRGSGAQDRPLPSKESLEPAPVAAAQRDANLARPYKSTWRMPTGVAIGGVGIAGIVAGAIFEHDVQLYNDEAKRISTQLADGSVATVNEAATLANRLNVLNDRGPKVSAAARGGFIGGGGLVALGAGFILWDFLRTPENENDVAAPKAALRFMPWGDDGLGLQVDGKF